MEISRMTSFYKTLSLQVLMISLAYVRCAQITPTANETLRTEKLLELHDLPQKFLENCSKYIVEKEFVLLENGSLLLPSFDTIFEYQTYFLENDKAFLCVEEELNKPETNPLDSFSDEFLSCSHVLIEPHEYILLENGSIYIDAYSKVYGPRDFYLQDHGVFICLPSYDEMNYNMSHNVSLAGQLSKFSISFTYVTYAGLIISIVSILSHLAVFCVVPSVRNLPGYCLASLSLSLVVAYSCFLAVGFMKSKEHCANIGMSIYYFFLTSFFWMNAIAFDIWRTFRGVMRELRISSHRVPWRRFLLYSLYSWLVPAALTAFVKVADTTDLLSKEYKPAFGSPLCWFGERKALLVFFAVPLAVVMFLNAIFFLDVTYVISRATLDTSQSHKAKLKKRFFMFMRLALIMGLTWVVGLIAGYVDNNFLWYLFIILNTLQGMFIFIVFSCSSKVKGICCKKPRRQHSKFSNTSVRTISQFSSAI